MGSSDRTQRRWVRAVLVVLVSAIARVADAQSSSAHDHTTQLASEARTLAVQGRWTEACPKFEQSLRIDPTIDRRLELAECYEQIRKPASAWRLYRDAIDDAEKANDFLRFDYAKRQVRRLESKLPRLTISLLFPPPLGFTIERDGICIDPRELGVATYLDPGEYQITVSAPGFKPFKQAVKLTGEEARTLTIPRLAAAISPNDPPRTHQYIAIGTSAVGEMTILVGLLFGWHARTLGDKAVQRCPALNCPSSMDYVQGKNLIHDAHVSATASTVLVIGGSAAVLTGVGWLLAAPRPKRFDPRIAPWLGDGAAGLTITGGF